MKQHQQSTASSYSEACTLLRSGYVKHVAWAGMLAVMSSFELRLTGAIPGLK